MRTVHVSAPLVGRSVDLTIDEFPDYCPHCHIAIVPTHVNGVIEKNDAFLGFLCVRNECNRYFVAQYYQSVSTWRLQQVFMGYPKTTVFSEAIQEISPSFVSIYKEAEIAQQDGLKQICGMGYRKALEFLIKDYIVFKDPTKTDAVKNELLGPCINQYIQSQNIKDIASRAAWLGNDESHYVRKWVEMDVDNLRQLISLTTHWIQEEYLTAKILEQMPTGRR